MPVIVLRPVGLSWVGGAPDAPTDLCAHGKVDFRIGGDVLVDPTVCSVVTVSAAALHLLRSLTSDPSVGAWRQSQLFPCCGFDFLVVEGSRDVVMFGCPSGSDFDVTCDPVTGQIVIARDGRVKSLFVCN